MLLPVVMELLWSQVGRMFSHPVKLQVSLVVVRILLLDLTIPISKFTKQRDIHLPPNAKNTTLPSHVSTGAWTALISSLYVMLMSSSISICQMEIRTRAEDQTPQELTGLRVTASSDGSSTVSSQKVQMEPISTESTSVKIKAWSLAEMTMVSSSFSETHAELVMHQEVSEDIRSMSSELSSEEADLTNIFSQSEDMINPLCNGRNAEY